MHRLSTQGHLCKYRATKTARKMDICNTSKGEQTNLGTVSSENPKVLNPPDSRQLNYSMVPGKNLFFKVLFVILLLNLMLCFQPKLNSPQSDASRQARKDNPFIQAPSDPLPLLKAST